MYKFSYRADIEGMRGISVLLVLIFHAFPGRLPGGFVGVDVFFVISGYLITKRVAEEVSKGSFSLIEFYQRRILRLFPALIVLLFACAAIGYYAFSDDELQKLLGSTTAAAFFFLNFRLNNEIGYFDSQAYLKPLLHLWSLAIEEQFYFVWPILIIILAKNSIDKLMATMLLIFASLIIYGITKANDAAGAYYLPWNRFWEILIGCGLGLAKKQNKSELSSAFGLALILAVPLFARIPSIYPGWLLIVPCIGSALLISSGEKTWISKNITSQSLLCFFGRISYPLYLWHWPIFVFIRLLEPVNTKFYFKIFGLILSVILAILTTRYIENPLQRASRPRLVALILLMVMFSIGALSLYFSKLGTLAINSRIENHDLEQKKYGDLDFLRHVPTFPPCDNAIVRLVPGISQCSQSQPGTPTMALIGDSHAYRLFPGIAAIDKQHIWQLTSVSSCPPLMGIKIATELIDCADRMDLLVKFIATQPNIETVVLAYFGGYTRKSSESKDFPDSMTSSNKIYLLDRNTENSDEIQVQMTGLERTIKTFETAGKRVVLFIDIPTLPFDPRDCLRRYFLEKKQMNCSVSRISILQNQSDFREIFRKIKLNNKNVLVYDPIDSICDNIICNIEVNDILLYSDTHHLSLRGSSVVVAPFIKWLKSQDIYYK